MKRGALQSLKELFFFSGAPVREKTPEPGGPYFSDSEKKLLRRGLRDAYESVAEAGERRGYKPHRRIKGKCASGA
jgi:hypothetical protein